MPTAYRWYHDQTAAQVASLLNANSARLIEIDRYDRGGGQIRYAVVMVPNTGNMARAWSYLLDLNARTLGDHINRNNMRPIDLDTYGSGSGLRYNGIFVANTGNDARAFQWASGQTPGDIAAKVSAFQGRVVKLERQADGKYRFVQVKANGSDGTAWWHRYGFGSLTDLNNYALQFAARPIDLVSYTVGGTRYYDAGFIDNANAGVRRMRTEFAPFVDAASQTPKGIFEAYLKRLDSGVRIDLNGARRAETASALKVLHLLHALRQVQSGADTLTESFDHYDSPPIGYDPNFPPEDHCPDPAYEFEANRHGSTLEPAMDQMMAISDNRITRAVVKRAGDSFAPLNATASKAGMVLRHNIGCGYRASPTSTSYTPSTRRNDTTAADLARIYEGVWTQQLLTNAHGARDALLRTANPNTGAWDELQAVITQEANAQGKGSQALAFGSQITRWGKAGGYGTCLGDPNNPGTCGQKVVVLANGGFITLPIKDGNGRISPRYFSWGFLVSDVPVSDWGGAEEEAIKDHYRHIRDELFRDEIRTALQTW